MDIMLTSVYIYLGIILGIMGGAICMVLYPKDKILNTIYILSGGVIGTLISIAILGMQLSKFSLVSIIAFGYVGASIITRLTGGAK